jgi:DUF2075 family protein
LEAALEPQARETGQGRALSSLWASDPRGFNQVGCIYTAQGFEYDYAGVIMGADLLWRDDRWVADSSASKDPVVRPAPNFDELVRHSYRVLLTRGLVGCIVFSVDRPTTDFLLRLGVPPVETGTDKTAGGAR